MRTETEYIKVSCDKEGCTAFNKCCFLPTEIHPDPEGKVQILFIGMGGGKDERKYKRPFIGVSGKRLRQLIILVRRKLEKHIGVAISNIMRDNPGGNRAPNMIELECCLPYLYQDIKVLKERGLKVLMPLGKEASRAILPGDPAQYNKVSAIRGKVYTVENEIFGELPAIPTYHPAFIIRDKWIYDEKKLIQKEIEFMCDIEKAYEL